MQAKARGALETLRLFDWGFWAFQKMNTVWSGWKKDVPFSGSENGPAV